MQKNSASIISLAISASVFITGLVVIPVFQQAQASNPTSEERSKGLRGEFASEGKRQGVVYCVTSGGEGFATTIECSPSREVCQDVQAVIEAPGGRELIEGCTKYPEPPEGASCVDAETMTSHPCP